MALVMYPGNVWGWVEWGFDGPVSLPIDDSIAVAQLVSMFGGVVLNYCFESKQLLICVAYTAKKELLSKSFSMRFDQLFESPFHVPQFQFPAG
jgi:hypothetical protein